MTEILHSLNNISVISGQRGGDDEWLVQFKPVYERTDFRLQQESNQGPLDKQAVFFFFFQNIYQDSLFKDNHRVNKLIQNKVKKRFCS